MNEVSEDALEQKLGASACDLERHVEALDAQFLAIGQSTSGKDSEKDRFYRFEGNVLGSLRHLGFSCVALDIDAKYQHGVTMFSTKAWTGVQLIAWILRDQPRLAQEDELQERLNKWLPQRRQELLIQSSECGLPVLCCGFTTGQALFQSVFGLLAGGRKVAFYGNVSHSVIRPTRSSEGYMSLTERVSETGIKVLGIAEMTSRNWACFNAPKDPFVDLCPAYASVDSFLTRYRSGRNGIEPYSKDGQTLHQLKVGNDSPLEVSTELPAETINTVLSDWHGYFWHDRGW
jgi:hypothetical protein